MTALALAVALSIPQQAAVGRTVLAAVFDRQNQPLVDIDVDDFVISEAGKPQEVLSAHIADYPVAILVDDSAAADLDAIRTAVARFVVRIGDRPVALGTIGAAPTLLATFTDDRATVLRRLDSLTRGSGEPVRVLQGLANAARSIQALDVPFSAIVVIAAAAPAAIQNEPTELLTDVLQSHAIVHVVEHRLGDAASGTELRSLTAETRGQYASIFSAASYQAALDRLADQMSVEMMIEYVAPGNGAPGQDVTVGVRVPGARVVGLGVR